MFQIWVSKIPYFLCPKHKDLKNVGVSRINLVSINQFVQIIPIKVFSMNPSLSRIMIC
uniref:Uncharacterized protein n=1 Tax=Lepeophtheirus salmonis TaxID=72036 RepID=A0A0K2V0P2_LEPSM